MIITSWNVNGIRAVHRKGYFEWLLKFSPDIFCLQETKARPDQLSDELLTPPFYKSYFNWPQEKKGYSGVAIYSKTEPLEVFYGIGSEKWDFEGRIITAYYKDFIVLNVYFPNGGGGPDRLKYKFDFYKKFLRYINTLREKENKNIIFCGDVNTAHNEIDLARPKENEKNTGFLPEERAWIDEVIENEYVDAFRYLYSNLKDIYTYWDMKTYARDRNVGWRIDYFFMSAYLLPTLKEVTIHSDVLGSDHCPLSVTLDI